MDFLKTLMLYMSLTFASSMQAAPVPEVTPVPTATPAIVETVAPAPQEQTDQAAPAATPAQPAQTAPAAPAGADAPAPTITPNAGYRNVKQGDRGDNVTRLQQRLIELGYLEEGSADGVFGGQTRKAVIAFQAANGLTADGVAGDATQTHLYENPDVKENPDRPTPTPEATATPAPTAEPTAAPESTIAPPAASAEETQPVEDVQRQWLWQASIVYNDGGAPLVCLRQEDGVTVTSTPRLYMLADGSIQLSLTDLAAAIEDWELTCSDTAFSLTAAGYALTLTAADGAFACTVDGANVALAENDAALVEGDPCVSAAFLEKALGAETIWDGEESTLIIRLTSRELTQATD